MYLRESDHASLPHSSLLADNYVSLTTRHYPGFGGVSGKEPLPRRTHSCLSGYSCNLPRTTPTAKQVERDRGRVCGCCLILVSLCRDRGSSLLRRRQSSFPNHSGTKVWPPPLHTATYHTPSPALRGSQHTQREDTGFTHAQNIEPVTFRPPEAFANDLSPEATWRPTGKSVMKKDFSVPSQHSVS